MKSLLFLAIALLSSFSLAQEPPSAIGCITLVPPKGWERVPRDQGLTVFRSREQHQLGQRQVPDVFTARVIPANGGTLEDMKRELLRLMGLPPAEVEQVVKEGAGPRNEKVGLTGVGHPVVTDFVVDTVPAFQTHLNTHLTLDENKIPTTTLTVVLLAGDRFYVVAASFDRGRESTLRPLARTYLASINAQACR